MFAAILLATATSLVPACPTMSNSNVSFMYVGDNTTCSWFSTHQCAVGTPIQFQATGFLYSFACAPHSFFWNFGDGTAGTGENIFHTFVSAGNYTVSVVIANPKESVTVAQTITVLPVIYEYLPPMVSFIPRIQGTSVGFTARVYPLTYPMNRWVFDFGDGSQETVLGNPPPEVVHVYQAAGRYSVTLTGIDGNGTHDYRMTITVPLPSRSRAVRH